MLQRWAIVLLCFCSSYGLGYVPKVHTIDIRASSAAYARLIDRAQHGGMKSEIFFLSEQRIAVSIIDRNWKVPGQATLILDFFGFDHGIVSFEGEQQFKADISEPKMVPLWSGKYLLNLGSTVLFYSADQKQEFSKSAAEMCGLETLSPLPNFDLLTRVNISPGEEVGMLLVDQSDRDKRSYFIRESPIVYPPPAKFCWFDIVSGGNKATLARPFPKLRAGDVLQAVGSPEGWLTPSGIIEVVAHCENPRDELLNSAFSFVRWLPDGTELEGCMQHGELVTSRLGVVTRRKSFGKRPPDLVAYSRNAPVVLLDLWRNQGNPFTPFFGGLHLEVFDYEKQKTLLMLTDEDLPRMPGYWVMHQAYALSPSGSYLADINGAYLDIREIRR